jgi:hypothetical protein
MIKNEKKYLLFIEPQSKKMEEDIDDELTVFAQHLKETMTSNHDQTKGFHSCRCGKAHSGSVTYSVSVAGEKMITNSLLVHYVKNHRSEVPEEELNKLRAGLTYWQAHQHNHIGKKKIKP